MTSKTGIIIRREYMERVSKKSFIITTLLMPVLMVALMCLPALVMLFSTPDNKTVAVIDDSGLIASALENSESITFVNAAQPRDSLIGSPDYYGVLIIESDILTRPSAVKLYASEASSLLIEEAIISQMNTILEREKLKAYDIDDLDSILADVKTSVKPQVFRTDTENETSSQSAAVSYGIGMFMMLVLYMFMLMYGAMVMNSIIEEKNNRVLEIVVSSVSPTKLMLGKIIGVGLVAITQILIWIVLIGVVSGLVLPAIVPADMLAQAESLNAGTLDPTAATIDTDIAGALASFCDLGYIMTLFGYLLLFLIGGFLFYASMFAAVGSAVDNVQDASQLQTVVVMPVILGLVLSMSVISDPNSTMALILSLIPFTAPMVMMARIPFGIAGWEIGISALILYASFLFMVWLAAKIYRVGIFMYGKKPSIKDLIRWAKYK